MKKLISLLPLLILAICLVGCDKTKEVKDTINSHIIEVRNNIYVGSDKDFYATFCSGEREDPYSLDGVVENKVPFGIVTISKLDNSLLNNDDYQFTITINGEEYKGELSKSPYDNTYSADVGVNVDDNAEISLSATLDGKTFEQTLYNENKNFNIKQDDAIMIAVEELEDKISQMLKNGSPEVIIKILKDYSGETNHYFWYIGLVGQNGDTAGILIDTMTGKIISKKV